jgi:hypothetical protein
MDSTESRYQEDNMRQHLITAAFFMEGLHDARPEPDTTPNYDALITTWNKGCIELVDALVGYVPYALKLCEAGATAGDGTYPGVFDYEVSSCFGRWFAEHILEHGGDEPPQMDACAWLVKEVGAFFVQGMTGTQSHDIKTAINKASLLHYQLISTAPMPS